MRRTIIVVCVALALSGAAFADQDVTAAYVTKDFSSLLMPKSEFLGFIGNDYQRLFIHFYSISQDKRNPALYYVKGSSEAKGIVCGFEGTITVRSIVTFRKMHWGVDDKYKDKGVQAEGVFSASYELREDRAQKHAGVFAGQMKLDWFADRDGTLRYDDMRIDADDYSNNQYTGTWMAYSSDKSKTANWGEYRIPNSGDLGAGIGEFSPNPKYCSHGWGTYPGCKPGEH